MKFYFLFFLYLITISFHQVFAQESYIKKTANDFYLQQNYPEALRLYESLLLKEQADTASLRKMALCYLKTKQPIKAEQVLLTLTNQSEPKESILYLYASTLCMNGKYEQANDNFNKLLQLNPRNLPALKYKQDLENVSNLFSDSSSIVLQYLSLNTSHPEFSPMIYQGKLLFVSSRINNAAIKRVYEYNNTPFLDIYAIDLGKIQSSTVPNAPIYIPHENSILFDSQKKLHESLTKETSNDNASPSGFNRSILHDSTDKTDKLHEVELFNKNIQTTFHEGPFTFNKNQNKLYFTSNNLETKKNTKQLNTLKIYTSELNSDKQFSSPIPIEISNNNYSIAHPTISTNDSMLIFSSNMPGGKGGMDLYKCYKQGNGWSKPENIKEINTSGDDVFPFLDTHNQLFYSSDGNGGLGGLDIFYVNLSYLSSIKNPGYPINSSRDDFGVLLSSDNKSGYISSNRKGNGTDDNIYYFTANKALLQEIPKPKNTNAGQLTFRGYLKEKEKLIPIQTMVAVFKNLENNLTDFVYSDSLGDFSIQMDTSAKYLIKIADARYYIITDTITTTSSLDTISRGYLFEKNIAVSNSDSIKEKWKPYVSKVLLNGTVIDKESKTPLEAIIKVTSLLDSSNAAITISDFDGAFSSSMPHAGTYAVDILSEGYKLNTTIVELKIGTNIQEFPIVKIKNDYDSLHTFWIKKKTKGTLNGTILAAPKNEPLTDIAVLFPEGDTLLEDYTISDFDGKFSLKLRKGVYYTLLTQDDERGDISKRIILNENDSILTENFIYPDRSTKVKINLDSIAKAYSSQDAEYNTTYKATILDKESKTPVDAMVAIQSNPEGTPDEVTVSDFDGVFSFKIKKHKTYYVSFVSQGYETYKMLLNSDDSLLLPSVVYMDKLNDTRVSDSIISVYKAKLKEKATIIGDVSTLEENEPLMAFIAIYKDGESTPTDVHPSDENGNFSFSLKRGLLYKIEIMELGYLPLMEYLNTADTTSIFKLHFKLKKPIKKEVFDSLNTNWKEQAIVIEEQKKKAQDSLAEFKQMKGYVYETETYIPITTRLIVIDHQLNKTVLDTLTSKEGKYNIRLRINRNYTIHFEAAGYKPDSAVVHITSGMKKSQSVILLSKESPLTAVNKKQEPVPFEGNLIENSSGLPVQTVIGIFADSEQNLVDLLHSDENGNFSTLLFPETNYIIKVADARYAILTDSFNSARTPINKHYELINNVVNENIDSLKKSWQQLIPKIQLKATISNKETNEGLKALVYITNSKNSAICLTSISNEEGIVSAELPNVGNYQIEVLCEGYNLYTEKLNIEKGINQKDFKLDKIHASYDSIKTLWIKKFKGTLNGTIVLDPSEPLSDFVIAFEEGDTILQNYTISDFDGKFTLPLKKETHYTIIVQDSEFGDQVKRVFLPAKDSVIAQDFVFQKSDNPLKIDFDSLAKRYYLLNQEYNTHYKATITDSKSNEPIEALIAIQSKVDSEPDEVTATNPSGEFSLQVRKHKSYLITIVSENYVTKSYEINSDNYFPDKIALDRMKEIKVIDSMIALYQKQLTKKVNVLGSITDELSNEPVMAFAALFKNGESQPSEVHPADFDGFFSFQLDKNQKYNIQILESGYLPILERIDTYDSTTVYNLTLKLKKPVSKAVYDSISTSWKEMEEKLTTTIYGSIQDKLSHAPVATDVFILQSENKKELAHSYSNFNGKYKVSTPTQTQYQVKIGNNKNSKVYILNNPNKSRIIYRNYLVENEIVASSNKDARTKNPPLTNAISNKNTKNSRRIITSYIGEQKQVNSGTPMYQPLYFTNFSSNISSISPSQSRYLKPLQTLLKQDTTLQLVIVGYADNIGSDSTNLILSQKRAESLKQYLIKNKINQSQITSVTGIGESNPVTSNLTEVGRAINRRVEYSLTNFATDSILILYPTGIKSGFIIPTKSWATVKFKKQLSELIKADPQIKLHFEINAYSEKSINSIFDAIQNLVLEIDETKEFTYSFVIDPSLSKENAVFELFLKAH